MSAVLLDLVEAIDRYQEAVRITRKDDQLAPTAARLARAMRTRWRGQGRAFLKALGHVRNHFPNATTVEARARLREAVTGSWEPLWQNTAQTTHQAGTDAVDKAARASLTIGGQATQGSIGRAREAGPTQPGTRTDSSGKEVYDTGEQGVWSLDNPRAVAWLAGHAAAEVTGIDEATRERVGQIITEGVNDGLSYEKIASQLRDQFENWGSPQEHIRDRAELVAVTETHMAYEQGSWMVAQDLADAGLDMEKHWLTVGDDRVDEDCEENENEDWIALEDVHASGDDVPPAHPACRCTEEYRRVGAGGEEVAPEGE